MIVDDPHASPRRFLWPLNPDRHPTLFSGPKMTRLNLTRLLPAGLLLAVACSPSSPPPDGSILGGLGGNMSILSCSLGCGSGILGYPVTCGVGTIKANEEIAIEFTQPVDLATIGKATFRITDSLTGLAPAGVYILDPANDRRVIFRPQISFDSNGTPKFGFKVGSAYTIRVNGKLHNPGPYLQGQGGDENLAGMLCNVSVGPGLVDNSPGPSELSIFADHVVSYGPGGEVLEVAQGEVTGPSELTDVWALSSVRLTFDDIISPVTVLSPDGKSSPTIRFSIDPDGIVGDSGDWIPLAGQVDLELHEATLTSTLTFLPSAGFPSAGSGVQPRRIVIEVAPGIQDLAGAPLANPGVYSFVPEANAFGEVVLPAGGETFETVLNMDAERSGALWGGGQLLAGYGGGSGKLGDLRVDVSNSPYVLDTDTMDFQNFDVLLEGSGSFPPSTTPPMATTTDGVFEFASLEVASGTELRLEGSKPARVFVRGRAFVAGLVSGTGKAPADNTSGAGGHLSNELAGGVGGAGGPNGGQGGVGGDRPDNTGTTLLFLPGPGNGQPNPGAVVDGSAGQGIAGADPALTLGGGEGGIHWPPVMPFGLTEFGDFQTSQLCQGDQVANPGAGGGYSTTGGESDAMWPNPALNDPAGINMWPGFDQIGGDPLAIGITPLVKQLSPELGHLRGGSAGGGGGAHVHLTRTNGPAFGDCLLGSINFYSSHSAAGGGGGGGALQLQAGTEVRVVGLVDLRGGAGGDAADDPTGIALFGQSSPGGGGSGGVFLAQARQVIFSSLTTSLNISGGEGGTGVGGSTGGAGGAGILRIESEFLPDPLTIAPKVKPFDADPLGPFGGLDSDVLISVGTWDSDTDGPGMRSGSQSCWLRPDGIFFQVTYPEDDFSDPLNPFLGWDMMITTPAAPGTPFSYRNGNDPNNPFGSSAESLFGSDLGGVVGAPVVVRFQGARLAGLPDNLCDATFDTEGGEIQLNSLTPWVRHPSELNTYWESVFPGDPQEVESRRPNIIRYIIVFDRSSANWPAFGSVESFGITTQPD